MSAKKAALPSADDVLRDVGYAGFVAGLFNRSNHQAQDFTHAILGIATEASELLYATDAVNGLEETGDLAFYKQALINLVEEYTGEPFDRGLVDAAFDDLVVAGDEIGPQTVLDFERTGMLDIAKRWIGYGKAPANITEAAVQALAYAEFAVSCAAHGAASDLAVRVNVEKLVGRYNGLKFSAERAVNRDVEAERRALEASASAS